MTNLGAKTTRLWLAPLVGGLMATALAASALGDSVTTNDDLLNAQDNPNDWVMNHGSYAATRYSKLDQINTDNVGDLQLKFTVGLGGMDPGSFWEWANNQATPLVEDGMIYTTNGWGQLYKINVRKADQGVDVIEWIFDPEMDKDWVGAVACCSISNRGVALWQDSLIYGILDGRLLRIRKSDGTKVWEVQLADPAVAETITVAPLVIGDIAISGVSGAELGIRGWLAAVDLNTGKEVWRRHTVPKPGEPGSETWKDDHDAWMTGGGSTWVTGSYDPELNLVYWGVGNPGPSYDHEYRPGDNLYTDSMIALDPATGEIKFHYQYTPNDNYDFDGVNELILVDGIIGGKERKAMIHADRNGFFYALDRTTGEFIYGKPYIKEINWTKGLDEVTGIPLDYIPESDLQYYVAENNPSRNTGNVTMCPNLLGAKNWPPMAYNPNTNMAYIPNFEACIVVFNVPAIPGETYKPRDWFTGGGFTFTPQPIASGSLTVVDVATGRVVKKVDHRYPLYGGILTTAGNLVFSSTLNGTVRAFDAKTLDLLWSFESNIAMNSPIITFAVDGKQYIAVGSGTIFSVLKYFLATVPGMEKVSRANMLWVFALPD